MQAVILKCPPYAQYHFGRIAPDQNTSLDDTSTFIHSDTLFSAIINMAAKMLDKSELDVLIDDFDTGKIKMSSGFYLLQIEGKNIFFLPKPAWCIADTTGESKTDSHHLKSIKKVAFISKTVWEMGIPVAEWGKECRFIQDKFVVHHSELNEEEKAWEKIKIYHKDSLPKVNVHKPNRDNSIYYQTNIQIGGNTNARVHFYFLLENNSTNDTLKNVLNMLKYEGIGGERTVGCGHLEDIDYQPFELNVNSTHQCNVSLFNPNDDKELEAAKHYDIITRGGRPISSNLRLKRIKMMSEGAIFDQKVSGTLSDITPKGTTFPYLRYGKAFCLPVPEMK